MTNKRESIIILLASPEVEKRYLSILRQLDEQDPHRNYHLWSAFHPFQGEEKGVVDFYQDFGQQRFDFLKTEFSELAQQIRSHFDLEPKILYSSDLAYLRGNCDEGEMLARVAFTLQKSKRLFTDLNVTHVFSGGGGNSFSNSIIELALRRGIKCFRFHPLQYFNEDSSTARVYFSDNNYHRISEDHHFESDDKRWRLSQDQARRYITQVREGYLRPDRDARAIGKKGLFTPNSFWQAQFYFFRHLIKCSLYLANLRVRPNFQDKLRFYSYWRKVYLSLRRFFLGNEKVRCPYFLFVLHHPLDSQLTFRGRSFLDQLALAATLANNLPSGVTLYLKEHPVFPGMLPVGELRRLLKKYTQIRFLDSHYSLREWLHSSSAVITINSTAGLEAMILGIPVVVFGEAFYRGVGVSYDVSYLGELGEMFKNILNRPRKPSDEQMVKLLAKMFYHSEPDPQEKLSSDELDHIIAKGILRRILHSPPIVQEKSQADSSHV